jgi:hypothetical protein
MVKLSLMKRWIHHQRASFSWKRTPAFGFSPILPVAVLEEDHVLGAFLNRILVPHLLGGVLALSELDLAVGFEDLPSRSAALLNTCRLMVVEEKALAT